MVKANLIAIILASNSGHIEVVKVLLNDSRVDPSAQDNLGKELEWYDITSKTAIKWACENGHIDIVKVLLNDSRVDPNARDRYGHTGKNLEDMV